MEYKDKVISILNSQELSEEQKAKLEEVFPQLKESEDERIRKALMQNLKERFGTKGNMGEGLDMPNVLAWLEKQGEQKPVELKTKAGNWYVCDMEVMNENMVTAFHRDEIYYCPKDGYLDVCGALFEVGCLDVFRLATEKEIPQSHWKPSDEQMNALNYVVNLMASSERPTENDLYYNILKSLRQQLKKLREK